MMAKMTGGVSSMTSLFRPSSSPPFNQEYLDSPDDLKRAVHEWEQGTTDTITYNDGSEVVLVPGVAPGGPNVGKPVFQYKKEPFTHITDGGLMVAESANCVAFIPGGFRGADTPHTMNPVREDIGGNSALMSLVHVLTIPKSQRIYGAVTLKPEHKELLKEMKELGEMATKVLMEADVSMAGSLPWVYKQTGTIAMKDGTIKSNTVVMSDLSPSCQKNFGKPIKGYKIFNSFHVYPMASIGWLHLHSYVGDLLTTAHDTMEWEAASQGKRKNTPYEYVFKNIK
jgi:hypothetical protein